MAFLGETFDANTVDTRKEFEALAPGEYPVVITKSGMEPAKSGGAFLKLELQVIDGPAKGRVLFDRLNLQNKNETAVRIARETLSSICHAVGKLTVSDSEQLHNLPLVAKVATVPRKVDGVVVPGEFSNEVKNYLAMGGSKGVVGTPANTGFNPAQAQAPAGGLPWQNRA
jgi:hypothetical protein